MVGYDFDEARFVWVREIDREEGQPGALICVAYFTGNKQDYVPKTFQQAAEEKRRQGRIKRAGAKLRDAEQEFITPFLIDQPADDAMPIIDITPDLVPVSNVEKLSDYQKTAQSEPQPKRLTFASDEELAAWAIQNPESLTSNQVRVLRGCLQQPSAIELFRLSGIDVETLRNIIRAAA